MAPRIAAIRDAALYGAPCRRDPRCVNEIPQPHRSAHGRRRVLSLLAAFALLSILPSCTFLMDEFFVLQKAPPTLEQMLEVELRSE